MEIILGSIVSLIIQALKKKFDTNTIGTLSGVVVLSLVAAFAYTYLVSAGYWETLKEVLLTAGAFYSFILLRFEK